MAKFTKQPDETLDYDFDFGPWMASKPNTAVTSFQTVVEPGLGLVVATRAGNVVKVVLTGGENGKRYKVTVRLLTDTGLVREADAFISVRAR